ncbi:unnamed protein product [Symbiodinium sp. CCMP2456]|nr:unnamed protein product [Symbiodinium sp. CCMP2456]
MGRRGQIAIDRIVALRSSVLPIYVIIRPNSVTTADEVSEDGNDFLTTRMFGDQIAFQSISGDYLSAEGDEIGTRRYCSTFERFSVVKQDTQYSFRTASGKFLSVSDRAPFVTLGDSPGDTESFQLFSLMMYGVNVGQQLELLDRVVAGIKPAGATVDYGPYTAAGFSPSQQHQFGVNVTGHIKTFDRTEIQNFQRFRIATKALQPCIDPSISCKKDKQFGLDQKAMMHLLGTVLEDAWDEVTAEDPALKEWTRLRSSCQQQCMTVVLSWSLRTLWSTGELLSRGGGASFSSALADAVRACYPGFRALRADEVAQKVGKIVARGLEKQLPIAAARADFSPDRRLSFNQNPSCLEQSSLDAEDRERFVLQLEVSVEKAVKTAEMRSWSTMEQAARPCQQTCRRAVMKQVGNADMLVMTSVEGALAACLTQLPGESAEALAGEALLHMRPEPETRGRLLLSSEAMKMPARDAAGDTGLEGLRLGDLPLGSLSLVGIALLALVPLAHGFLKRTGTFAGATQDAHGCVMIDHLLDGDQLGSLRDVVVEESARLDLARCHEVRLGDLAAKSPAFAELATHPLVMQLARRLLSPALLLSDMQSCRTDVDYVRKELEETTWHVVHPYSSAEFPGVVDPRINVTVTWFLDQLDTENSTWAFVKAPLGDGGHLPQLPHLSSQEELQAVARGAQPLLAKPGAAWLCIGPYWMSNNVGAASFWKDYDAQTRYKHLSGQKEQSFRALTDAQRAAQPREELCPTVLQATYVREHVVTPMPPAHEALAQLGDAGRQLASLFRAA